jgi:phosphoribosylformimino-5-aminoimidazole carboxamide ribotide isomerase
MELYPAIDLKSGACVRLYEGAFDQVTIYDKDPVTVAKKFQAEGAGFLHIVDLDGAKNGVPAHLKVIGEIIQKTGLQAQVGGGIRDREQLTELFNLGVHRVMLGSIVISQPETVKHWLQEFGPEKIVLALDIRMNLNNIPCLASHGWQLDTHVSLWDTLEEYIPFGLKHVLCTDISCDGTLHGPNIALYQECQERYPKIDFQASGGVGKLTDIKKLAHLPVAGVVIGKALYERVFTFAQAQAALG